MKKIQKGIKKFAKSVEYVMGVKSKRYFFQKEVFPFFLYRICIYFEQMIQFYLDLITGA